MARGEAMHSAALSGDDAQHNLDDYVEGLETLVTEQTRALGSLQQQIDALKEGLQAELAASQKMSARVYY